MDDFCSDWIANPKWWFNATPDVDELLKSKYEHLMTVPWDLFETITWKIGYVIAHDQLARHVFRNDISIINDHHNVAISATHHIIKYNKSNLNISIKEWCFILLPYRHTSRAADTFMAIRMMWEFIKIVKTDEDRHMCSRFLKASYEHVLDKEDDCYIRTYFKMDGPGQIKNRLHPHSNVSDVFEKFLIENPSSVYIISLSGGVDSMVCCYLLDGFKNKYKFDIHAVHINYLNRPDSIIDEECLIKWCGDIGIPIHVRRINEINRDLCMQYDLREIYENYTRSVRYNTYKQILPDGRYPVILGHNRDDCLENILTNIVHNKKYENLQGMTESNVVSEIQFMRPLLSIEKTAIYEFANFADISYFRDSTPSWSQRGRIRDRVVPCLKQWDPNCIPGMFKMANVLKESFSIIDGIVSDLVSMTTADGHLEIKAAQIFTNASIWRSYFQKVKKTCTSPSHKSIENCIARLQHIKEHFNTCPMNFKTRISLAKYTTIYIEKVSDTHILIS
jgi:tRNA(Ile)-lysidine synthetase-like protein